MFLPRGAEEASEEVTSAPNSDLGPRSLPGRSLRPSQFIARVSQSAEAALRHSGLRFNVQARSRLVKFWRGAPAIHYEVWVHERESRLEIGFHLEAEEAFNAALYRELDRCLLDVQFQLGGGVWLERWDHGWARLYETQPLWPLDEARVQETVERLVQFIGAVEPIYEAILARLPS